MGKAIPLDELPVQQDPISAFEDLAPCSRVPLQCSEGPFPHDHMFCLYWGSNRELSSPQQTELPPPTSLANVIKGCTCLNPVLSSGRPQHIN